MILLFLGFNSHCSEEKIKVNHFRGIIPIVFLKRIPVFYFPSVCSANESKEKY